MTRKLQILAFNAVFLANICIGSAYNTTESRKSFYNPVNVHLAPISQVQAFDVLEAIKFLIENGKIKNEIRPLYERYRKIYGGKGFWCLVLEALAKNMNFRTPKTEYISVQDLWSDFIGQNQSIVNKGNQIVRSDLSQKEKEQELEKLISQLKIPEKIQQKIKKVFNQFKGKKVIFRSSGTNEDGFEQNLAGVFTSITAQSEEGAVTACMDIFKDAFENIWINQFDASESVQKEMFSEINAEDGLALVVQEFVNFEAAGTAMTYGKKKFVEAVFGGAKEAVQSSGSNHILFEKEGDKLLYNPSYDFLPDSIHGVTFESSPENLSLQTELFDYEEYLEQNEEYLEDMYHMLNYQDMNGNDKECFSPVSTAKVEDLNQTISDIEKILGIPLDVEWGNKFSDTTLVQIRPIVSSATTKSSTPSEKFSEKISQGKMKELGDSRNVIGSGEFQGPMIVVGNNVSNEALKQLDESYPEGYALVIRNSAEVTKLNGLLNAKVVIDPVFSSLGDHGITGSRKYFDDHEMIYSNGINLSWILSNHFSYRAHENLDGIFVSEENLGFFSSGLVANVYKSEEEITHAAANQTVAKAKSDFLSFFLQNNSRSERYEVKKDKIGTVVDNLLNTLFQDQLLSNAKAPGKAVINVALENSDPTVIAKELLKTSKRSDLEAMIPYAKLFDEVYDCPLLSRLQPEIRLILNRIKLLSTVLSDIDEALVKKSSYTPRSSGKTKVLIFNDTKAESTKQELERELTSRGENPDDYEVVAVSQYSDAISEIKSGQYDSLIIDAEIKSDGEAIFIEAAKKTSFPMIMLHTGWSSGHQQYFNGRFPTKKNWWKDNINNSNQSFRNQFIEMKNRGTLMGLDHNGIAFSARAADTMATALTEFNGVLKEVINEKAESDNKSASRSIISNDNLNKETENNSDTASAEENASEDFIKDSTIIETDLAKTTIIDSKKPGFLKRKIMAIFGNSY